MGLAPRLHRAGDCNRQEEFGPESGSGCGDSAARVSHAVLTPGGPIAIRLGCVTAPNRTFTTTSDS